MLRQQRGPTRQQPTAQCTRCRGRQQGPGHSAGCMLQQQQLQAGGSVEQQPPAQGGLCRGRQPGPRRISGRMLQQQQLQKGGRQSSTQCRGRKQGPGSRSGRMPGTWRAAGVFSGHGHPLCRGHAQVGFSASLRHQKCWWRLKQGVVGAVVRCGLGCGKQLGFGFSIVDFPLGR